MLRVSDVTYNPDEDVEDAEEYTDTDLGAVDEHKSIILHLLSQLKLGMDLTKVRMGRYLTCDVAVNNLHPQYVKRRREARIYDIKVPSWTPATMYRKLYHL